MSSFIETLLKDLRSNDPVVRCGVIGQIENRSWTAEQIEELRRLAANETDRRLEISLMLLLQIASQESSPEGRFNELAKLLQQPVTDILQILLRLKGLPPTDWPRAAELLRLRGLGGLPDAALPWLFGFFQEHGSAADVVVLKPCLSHPNPRIVRAAFEALERLAPEELRPFLVKFLLSPLPEIRSQAIRLLQRWDPAEALRHLEAMLFDQNIEEQKAALFLVFYFRFDQVEHLMLRFLSLEENLDLLGRARDIFISNPLPEVPLKLVEVMEASAGEKQALLREIVLGVIDSLVKAGLVDKTPQELIAELQTSWKQRKVTLLIDRCKQALASANPAHREAARTRLQELAQHGFEEARQLLASQSEPAHPVSAPQPAEPPAQVDKRLRLDELAAKLFSVQPERRYEGLLEAGNHDFPSIREFLLKLVERETIPENRTLLRGLLEPHLDAASISRLFDAPLEAPSIAAQTPTATMPSPAPEYALTEIEAIRCTNEPVAPQPQPHVPGPVVTRRQATPPEFADLQSADPTIRFLALQRLDAADWDGTLDDVFRSLLAGQTDPVDRFLMELSLARRERRRRPLAPEATPRVIALEQILKAPEPDFREAALRLEGLGPRESKLAVIRLRSLSWQSFPIAFLPQVFALFRQHGGREDGAAIEPFCRHADPRVVLPAIEALEELNPEDLKPLLVLLLSSPSQGVRSRAVRLLYRWDREEAIRHFEATLFARHPAERQLALYHAWFLPFPSIEALLIKFLDIEDNLGLLTLAGYLIQSNPAPDLPLKLIGVMETCADEKQIMIGGLVTGVAQTLAAAGLIDRTAEDFLTDLKREWQERQEHTRLEQCRLAFAGKDPAGRAAALPHLETLLTLGRPEAIEVLAQAARSETDPALSARLRSLLEFFQPVDIAHEAAPKPKPAPPPKTGEPETLSGPERVRWLSALDVAGFKQSRGFIIGLAGSPEIDEDLRAAATRAIGQFGEASDASLIRKFIGDTRHRLVAAVIEAMSRLDPAQVQPLLPKLVQHPAEEVRSSAFRSFLRLDKRQAIAHLEQLLGSAKPEQRRAAIFAAGHVEFPTIQDLILHSLAKEDHPENLRQLGALFKAHLTFGLLVKLTSLLAGATDANKSLLTQLLDECAVQLHQGDRKTYPEPAAVLEKANRELAAEAERKARPSAPYTLKNIQKIRQQQEPPTSQPTSLSQHPLFLEIRKRLSALGESPKVIAVVILTIVVALGISIWSYAPEAEVGLRSPATDTASGTDSGLGTARLLNYTPAPFQIGEVRDIQGMVHEAWSDAVRVKVGHQPQQVHIKLKDIPRPFKAGFMFRGKIKILTVTADKVEAELVQLF